MRADGMTNRRKKLATKLTGLAMAGSGNGADHCRSVVEVVGIPPFAFL
jgi:hypothetical protein